MIMKLNKAKLIRNKPKASICPTVLFNCGWMERYDGPADIYGGGSYVKENGIGWEIYNFADFHGKTYGYAQPSGEINHIERIGANQDAESIDGVLAIFTATHPKHGGLYVVGWYHDAVLYREYQDKQITGRKADNRWVGYYLEAEHKNVRLLTPDERIGFIELPSKLPSGSGWKGRSNVWYADKNEGLKLKLQIIEKIEEYEKQIKQLKRSYHYMPTSAEQRNRVEKAAMNHVISYYEGIHYSVDDVSKDNVGWDLEAHKGKHAVYIEVKGLSGEELSVNLTKNEYTKMKAYKDDGFRLAVVTTALSNPTLYIFQFSNERNKWIEPRFKDLALEIDESITARCYV